jgi:(p)ppGpp synthase/HD superfamily hydrolase
MTKKEKALYFAEKAHINQLYGNLPYIYHIKQVVEISEKIGFGETVAIASALHDTIEDTSVSYNDIKKEFGEEIAEIVYCVTDENGRNRKERKEKSYFKIKSNPKALAVKICDRIANVKHSKLHNKALFEMYKKEHKDFCVNLSTNYSCVKLKNAWKILNGFFEN